jgi:hypothetical protein
MNTMKRISARCGNCVRALWLLALGVGLACFGTGCGTTGGGSAMSPAVVRVGVATGVAYSAAKYTNAVPYIRAATPVICSVANGTNLAPGDVIRAVELSDATALKTPEGVLILNAAMLLYTGVWQSYGSNAVANAPTLKLYLQATCDGLHDGLPGQSDATRASKSARVQEWPHITFP